MDGEPKIKNRRFQEMGKTGSLVKQEAAKLYPLLQQMRLFDDGGKLEEYCLDYLTKKVGNKPLRAYYSRKLYEYLFWYPECREAFQGYTNSPDLFFRKLPFVFELVITIQYLHNHILDEKYDAKRDNRAKIIQNLLSSNVLRELLFLYIEQEITPHFPDRKGVDKLVQNLRRLLLWVDVGQYLDKQYNNYDRWKEDLPPLVSTVPFFDDIVHQAINETMDQVKKDVPNKAAFVEAYFRRVYLSNVYFFRCMAKTVMDLGNYRGEEYQRLLIFSTQYGFMLQIINDYADFAYTDDPAKQKLLKTAGKKPSDLLADLSNFNVTLPLIYHLKGETSRNRKIEDYLKGTSQKKNLVIRYPKQIMQEIVQSGAIRETIERSKKLAESAKEYLDLKSHKRNPQSDFFANMCDMAFDNKFYQIFKQ